MALAEVNSQGQESDTPNKRKAVPPWLDVSGLIGSIQAGIEEKRRRDDEATKIMLERLDFDRAQAERQAQQAAAQQQALLDLVGAILKKV
ncbi:Aste57867_16213 [Aphanomyces stellatus]|uniref:Aste57867_16213 protein n=1 Tax=Aphanomyces stellatus TaxID=120398 RepID=A0A485L5P8_9STRA|nr:hypothetical protein As57867_016156 [Aphanomyces stellatus]VFT92991.1 Aste57867_16213 [Aphanomyces stellatus]